MRPPLAALRDVDGAGRDALPPVDHPQTDHRIRAAPETAAAVAVSISSLVRFDRRNGQSIGIQPKPGKGEPPLRWN